LPAVEAEMRSVLGADQRTSETADNVGRDDIFLGMIHYHMGWLDDQMQPVRSNSGKRIRPLLCLLTCSAAGGDWQQAVPAATAIEILHNFSLVHDDIQDASPTRRGRPTVWTLWGEPQAINTGDAMFALAHLALNRLTDRGVPSSIVVEAYRRFDETCVALTGGQYADMSFESRKQVGVDEYLKMITGKTAVLISLCCELGGLVADADEQAVHHLGRFGLDIGLAFQIHDDVLGIWGDESLTGKSAATDIVTRKKTLPVLYGLEKSSRLRALYQTEDNESNFVELAVRFLDEAGARKYAEERVKHYSDSALAHLKAAQPSDPAATALHQLSSMLLKRDH
jgi:geranylgeranyl diphosphate synthase type I